VDERVLKKYVTHEYSLGDFVVTSGEIPGLIMIDSIVRLIPGVLNKLDSALTDSFASDLLDAPHYTQPRDIEGMDVPDVLLSGHHQKIEDWRQKRREETTEKKRPDIWKNYLRLKESEQNDE
jgi:tRNA (guanine37-N1)-methyltransferase